MRTSGSLFLAIGAALFVGTSLSPELAASVRPDDIFELFMGADDANSMEDLKRRRVKIRQQSRASIFDLFDDERISKGSIEPRRKEPTSSALAARPEKKPSKQAEQVVSKPRAASKRATAKIQFASSPVPRTKPGVPTSRPPAQPRPVEESAANVTCGQAKEIIAKYAFSNVNPDSCSGNVYQFEGMRNGKRFLIKISARNGELLEVKRDNGTSTANEPASDPQANYHLVPKFEQPRR